MAFVTHFESPDGEKLPIAASTLVTVEIPAAGSADKGDWHQAAESTTSHYNQQAGHDAPKHSAVIPSCTDPSVFTDHGLRIEYEEQLQGWVLWIDSLPETACTLTLLFITHSTEDTPVVLPALGVVKDDEVVDLTGVFDFLTSILQGGAECSVDYDCAEVVERFKKGAVKVRVAIGDITGEKWEYAQIVGEDIAQTLSLVDNAGNLLYLNTRFSATTNKIYFRTQQVTTTAVSLS